MEIKHPFNSPKGDGPDSTRVRPSNWNANHTMTISQANRYIGRDKSGAGAAQELPVVPIASADDGTIWTAAKVQEYVAAAISAVSSGGIPMGTIVGSVVGTMPGFLPLNGQTFGRVGSSSVYESALYQNLYQYLWSLITPAIIVEGGKGASGLDDWNNGKSMFLPQSAGCVMGAEGLGGSALSAAWFTVVGADNVNISVDQLPAHKHLFPPGTETVKRGTNSGNGATGTGNVLFDAGAVTETAETGSGNSHPNVQRTMIMQIFWIKY